MFRELLEEEDKIIDDTTEAGLAEGEVVSDLGEINEADETADELKEEGVSDGKKWKFSKWKKGWDRDRKERRPRRATEGKKEYEERMLEVRRVTRVTTGWRQLAFRATMLIGNKNGKIGLGIAKANDVQSAVQKATHDAYKNVVDVTMTGEGTIPYPMTKKFRSALIKLVPAKPGTGLKAGSSVRSVLELAGYTNILSKIVGTNNILNNALLAIDMVSKFKKFNLRFKVKQIEADKPASDEASE